MARTRCIAVVRPACRPALRSALAVAILTGATLARGLSGVGDAPEIHLPDGSRPAVLDTFELPDAVQALAVSPDGRRAAVAVPVEGKGRAPKASIRVHAVGRDEPVIVPVQGVVRDLLFLEDGAALYAIEHRPAKRREGDSYLVRIDEESAKAPRVMRLPPSARDLDYWAAGRSLLVAARNELRTVTVPLMRSGPLFRVVGENLSVAVVGGSRVLVGQDDALVLVDLDDPQERESMPVRERIPSPAPVLSLALTADGSSGLASLADERVLAVELDPLAISDRGSGLVVDLRPAPTPASVAVIPTEATPRPPEPSPPAAPPAEPPPVEVTPPEAKPPAAEPSRPAVQVAEQPPPPPDPVPLPTAEEPDIDETPPAVKPQQDAPSESARDDAGGPSAAAATRPSPAPEIPPSPPTEEPVVDEPTVAETDTERDHAVRLRGRIEGPAADQVRHVVVFGPDNLLREAARVRPAADGRYEVTNLTAGRYGIQLSGGGNRVLVTEPRFLTVEVSADGPAVADFRVLRAL
jgi:hypothetical protein